MGSGLAEKDGVSVGFCVHGTGRAYGAAGAGRIFHDKSLPERPRHVLAYDPAGNVGSSTGGEWNDDRDCARWISLRRRQVRQGRECGSARCQMRKSTTRKFVHRRAPRLPFIVRLPQPSGGTEGKFRARMTGFGESCRRRGHRLVSLTDPSRTCQVQCNPNVTDIGR